MPLKFFDYECEEHGVDELLWDTNEIDYWKEAPCKYCGRLSPRVFVEFPNADERSFSIWNNYHDPKTGTFTDKKKYYQAIHDQGRMIYESGLEKDAAENEKRYVKKLEDNLRTAIRQRNQEYTLDELRNKIKVDAKIHDATMRGDANAIHAMGGMTSLDEANAAIKNDCINVRKVI